MNRSKRIEPIVKIIEAREQDAARILGEAQRRLGEQEARLGELMGYRDEYAQRFEAVGRKGLDIALLQDYRAFLARLGAAIEQQERQLQAARHDYELKRRHWLEARQQTKTMDVLLERYRGQELRVQLQREQRESDEYALRMLSLSREY